MAGTGADGGLHAAASPTRVRRLRADAVDADTAAAWDALASDPSEPNPFAERWCVLPGMRHFPDPAARLFVVEDAAGMVGVVPLTRAARYARMPLSHWTTWRHPNVFHGAPLVRAGAETAFWRALLTDVGRDAGMLHLFGMTEGGPLHRALATGRRADVVHREVRALLSSDLSPEDYWTGAVRGKKRKELRRQAARLADEGAVAQRLWATDEPVAAWIEDFLALESAGWKGREGSAVGSNADSRAWFADALHGAAAAGRLDMRSMTFDGRPIAMLIHFITGDAGFSFKTGFDEALARFSPGVQIQRAALDRLLAGDLAWVDSCAAEDHPMIDSLWRERRAIVRLSVPTGGTGDRLRFGVVRGLERLWGRMRGHGPDATGVNKDIDA